jgi:hypothetical protein
VPIDHATAIVHFPDAGSGSLRAQAFTGVYGSTEQGVRFGMFCGFVVQTGENGLLTRIRTPTRPSRCDFHFCIAEVSRHRI